VDGTGLKPIEDQSLARKLNEKVNAYNTDLLRKSLPLALLFSFFPFQTLFAAVDALFH